MKHSLSKAFFILLLLSAAVKISSAQTANQVKSSIIEKNRASIELPAGETAVAVSDSPVEGRLKKESLKTIPPKAEKTREKRFFGFNRKTKRNSPPDAVETLDADEQPIEEVFQTELVYPQERGEVQTTFSPRYGKGGGQSLFQNPVRVEYGITNNWQVEVEFDAQNRRNEFGEKPTRGISDLSFGTQYSFMNVGRSNFHTAVGLEITLPTANIENELTDGFVEYEPYFIVAKDFPNLNRLQVFSEVGIGFKKRTRRHLDPDDDEPAAHEFNLGVGAFQPFRRAVLTGEFNLSTNRWNNGGKEFETYFTPGIVWRFPRNFEAGVGVPLGLTTDAEKFGIIFKLVYEFSLFGRDDK